MNRYFITAEIQIGIVIKTHLYRRQVCGDSFQNPSTSMCLKQFKAKRTHVTPELVSSATPPRSIALRRAALASASHTAVPNTRSASRPGAQPLAFAESYYWELQPASPRAYVWHLRSSQTRQRRTSADRRPQKALPSPWAGWVSR